MVGGRETGTARLATTDLPGVTPDQQADGGGRNASGGEEQRTGVQEATLAPQLEGHRSGQVRGAPEPRGGLHGG